MIRIIFTDDTIENEPGPNLYWRGQPMDFLKLVIDLHKMGTHNDIEIDMAGFDYVDIIGGYNIVAKSSENGNTLLAIKGKTIQIDCNTNIWRSILTLFLSVSFYPSHNYIEFDDANLIEDANFIISSEEENGIRS